MCPELINGRAIASYGIVHQDKFRASLIIAALNRQLFRRRGGNTILLSLPLGGRPF
jgi:hypothetical protein